MPIWFNIICCIAFFLGSLTIWSIRLQLSWLNKNHQLTNWSPWWFHSSILSLSDQPKSIQWRRFKAFIQKIKYKTTQSNPNHWSFWEISVSWLLKVLFTYPLIILGDWCIFTIENTIYMISIVPYWSRLCSTFSCWTHLQFGSKHNIMNHQST